ncbi:MAG: GNAT family N-acetyltransferase [Acidimicrobiales bacterium]
MSEPVIRSYRADDLEALYDICLRTGAAGEDATELMADPRLLGDLYAAPYAVLEPEHAFVLDEGTGVAVGYVLGALDTVAFDARCETEWWPALRERHPAGESTGRLDDLFLARLHEPRPAPADVLARFPSHLHIDLLPPVQSGGWGRALLERLFSALRDDGSPGVHLGVTSLNQRAVGFYRHLGFEELEREGNGYLMGMVL